MLLPRLSEQADTNTICTWTIFPLGLSTCKGRVNSAANLVTTSFKSARQTSLINCVKIFSVTYRKFLVVV